MTSSAFMNGVAYRSSQLGATFPRIPCRLPSLGRHDPYSTGFERNVEVATSSGDAFSRMMSTSGASSSSTISYNRMNETLHCYCTYSTDHGHTNGS